MAKERIKAGGVVVLDKHTTKAGGGMVEYMRPITHIRVVVTLKSGILEALNEQGNEKSSEQN